MMQLYFFIIVIFCFVTGGSIGDVSVSWRVAGGSATPDLDYSASGGTLNFPAGQTRQSKWQVLYLASILYPFTLM